MKKNFTSQKPKWDRSLILICEKCSKKIEPSGDLANELKKKWKKDFKENGLSPETRIVTTSCLDICPTGEIAVARLTNEKEVFCFDPREEGLFLDFLKQKEMKTTSI
jgi:predicted metal-binding protein